MAVYGQVAGASNSLTNNKKVKLVAANVADSRIFTKASVSKMKASDFEGKKYGKSYTLYIPGKPKLVNGVVANPSDIVEVETQVFLDNDNVSTTLGPWQRLGDIESFQNEVAGPWALTLGRGQEKKIVANEIFKAMIAVVAPKTSQALDGASFDVLGKTTAKLRKLAISSGLTGFLDPEVRSEIAGKGLDKFIPSEKMAAIYGEANIGRYGTADWAETPDLPVVVTPASAATASITLTAAQDAGGNTLPWFETVTTVSGTNLFKGAIFNVAGLKIVDCSGIETEVPIQVVVLSANGAGTSGTISPLRIAQHGETGNNPNAWVATGTSTLTLTYALGTSKTYVVNEVRTKDCFAYDTYQFDVLPGSQDEMVSTVGGSSVKMRIFGDGTNLDKLVRIDSTYASSLFEPREAALIYVEA